MGKFTMNLWISALTSISSICLIARVNISLLKQCSDSCAELGTQAIGVPFYKPWLIMRKVLELILDLENGLLGIYWETKTEAGIIADGERVSANCVLACDGIHSKARSSIIGET